MVSENSCGKSSAKTVRGFTLIELLVVIAIIAILAGISSGLISGYVRDARLETANNKAQQVYTAVQNALIQFEIKQDVTSINAHYLNGDTSTKASYTYLELTFDNGTLKGDDVTVKSDSIDYTYDSANVYPSASSAGKNDSQAFAMLTKYVCGSLSSEFTGYAYISIDVENYVVDSVVYSEDLKVKNSANGVADFANKYESSANTKGNEIGGCDSVSDQKTKYKGRDTSHLDAAGVIVGFYPMMNDLDSSSYTKIG
jgi:prepilin-type N-terminal cleavage/methylation domain-containing protein